MMIDKEWCQILGIKFKALKEAGMSRQELYTELDKIMDNYWETESSADYLSIKNTVQQFSPAENVVMAFYPQFKNDYQILIDNGYMSKNGDYLTWNKSKQSLAEYFGYMWKENKPNQKIEWKTIQNLFQITGIRNLFSRNGNEYKNTSKDYEELRKILKSNTL